MSPATVRPSRRSAMNRLPTKTMTLTGRGFLFGILAASSLLATVAHAAAPGITGTSAPTATTAAFSLNAQDAFISQPDGASVYSWGYGCAAGSTPTFAPAAISGGACSTMQIPGPTLIVTEGQTVTVTLTNNLPPAAGSTSILFPGF